jgi:rod shape-determining protein MreB
VKPVKHERYTPLRSTPSSILPISLLYAEATASDPTYTEEKSTMLIKALSSYFSKDLAIDLGTANTLVAIHSRGVVLHEPSVVSLLKGTQRILAVGTEARRMLGRAPENIQVVRPLRDGVIADFECTMAMLRYFITKVHRRQRLVRPRIIIGVPSGITQVERRAVREAGELAGARAVYLIEEPMAAAIGAGMPITEPSGNMILDIGGGTTEVAVLSLSGVVYSRSVRTAGDAMDEAIVGHVKRKHNLLIGERTGEAIKLEIGTAVPTRPRTMPVTGRDLLTGLPKTIDLSNTEVYDAIIETVHTIVETVHVALESTPPELVADIIDRGLIITGGGALLQGLDALLREETGVPVTVAEEPLLSVVHGVSHLLDNIDLLKKVAQ